MNPTNPNNVFIRNTTPLEDLEISVKAIFNTMPGDIWAVMLALNPFMKKEGER
jgi:hypothetical protein